MQAQITRRVQILLTLVILVAATYLVGVTWFFLAQFMGTFILFFLAWLLAYLLKPLAKTISRTGLPFGVSAMLVYIVGPALALIAAFFLVPAITTQSNQISSHLDEYTGKLSGLVSYVEGALASLGVTAADIQGVESKISDAAQGIGQTVLQGAAGTVGGIGNELFRIGLVLVFSISFLLDGDKMAETALAAMPSRWRDGASLIVKSVETSFGSFVRGQLLSALAYALLNVAVMLAFGLPNVAIGALAAGLLVIVPLVGNYLAYIPPLVICMVANPDATLILLIVLVIVQGLYMNLISPPIMAKAVKMHPLVTMGSILIFGQIGGFWGALFGIPIASTIGMLAPPALRLVQNYLDPEDSPADNSSPQSLVPQEPQKQPESPTASVLPDNLPNEGREPVTSAPKRS